MVVSFIFAFGYVRYYQHKRERECGSTTIAILALTTALITGALIPVDIFLVSTLKAHDGTYHGWASYEVRQDIKDMVTYAYYAMYCLTELFVFLLLPLAYFFFEEKDEEAGTSTGKRLCSAMKYTAGFIIVFGVLMIIGAFALNSNGVTCNEANETAKQWIECRAQYAEKSLTKNGGTNALSFTIGALVVIGFIYFIMYTASGMVSLPISMIRSRGKEIKEDREEGDDALRKSRDTQESIRAKYGNKRKGMTGRDRDKLFQQQEKERVLAKATERLDDMQFGCCSKIATILRPFEFIFGIVFFLLGMFIVVSLFMTTLDKLLQIEKQNLNFKDGYSRVKPHLINPIDKLMTLMQKVFPLDYIFMTLLVYYFMLCTMAGVRALDVRMCCLKMYKIRPRRTVPQGLLFMCLILMFSILTLNVVFMTLVPQYVSFGNQHYSNIPVRADNTTTCFDTKNPYVGLSLCSYDAPHYQYFFKYQNQTVQFNGFKADQFYDPAIRNCKAGLTFSFCNNTLGLPDTLPTSMVNCTRVEEPCTQTRMAALLNAFFYNLWFLGAIYYWANWGIIGVFFFSLVFMVCKRRKSLLQSLVNDVQDDFDDSDDDMTPFNPSWKNKK